MADATDEEIAHLEQLVVTLRRRQRVLESQRARFGESAVPAHILLELEDLGREIPRNAAELRRLRPGPVADQNPYLGLLTFQEADADRFFGRDALVADLLDRAGRAPFLAVLGASGSGKSSVVRAGLVPLLKGVALPGSERWRYLTLRPGPRPLDALAGELARLEGDPTRVVHYAEMLATNDRALLLLSGALLDRAAGQRLVLVLDQAEELWTLAPTESTAHATFLTEQQRPFIQLLLTAIAAADAPLLVILTMRADFLHRAFEDSALGKALTEHDVSVSPMDNAELRDAIERPAELAGGSFEPGLVDELVEQTLGRAGALPLLEYTLQELWKQRQPNGLMTWAAYRALGGIEGALAARADAIMAEHYTADQQADLRRLLLRLVQPGEDAAGTRRRVLLDDLVPAGATLETIQALIKPLVDERLLTASNDAASGKETVELSHEALIRAWPAFGSWIAEARADLRLQLQLEEATKEWQVNDENVGLLWSGLRLAQAEAWIARAAPQLNLRDQAFLAAGRAAEEATRRRERTQARRLRWLAFILAIAVIAAAGFAIQSQLNASEVTNQRNLAQTAAVVAQQQSRISAAQASAGESLFELTRHNVDRALLLARAAILTDTLSSPLLVVRAIRQSTQQTIPAQVLRGHTSTVWAVAWSPDGKQLLTGSDDTTARVWNLASGQTVRRLEGHTRGVTAVAWSPDGKSVLTGSWDGTARVWNLASGRIVHTLEGHRFGVASVAWSPDGKQLVTGSWDSAARVWDLASGRTICTRGGHTGPVWAVAWSPDGKQLFTGDDRTARVWNLASCQHVPSLEVQTRGGVTAVAWSPDGKSVLTGSVAGTARMWDLANGRPVRTLVGGHTSTIWAVAWSPDGKSVLTGSDDTTAQVWDLASGQPVRTLVGGHTRGVRAVAWSPDGKSVLTGSDDSTARVWDLASGQPVRTLEGHTGAVRAVAWSPDGQTVRRLEHYTNVNAVAWSPDGKSMLTGSDDTTGSDDRTARVWDLANDRTVRTLEGHTGAVRAVAWSPDGKSVLTGSDDRTARVWDLSSGQTVYTLEGHTSSITAVAWSPDGKSVLTGSDDRTARVWDLANDRTVYTLEGHTGAVRVVAWLADGKQLLTGSDDTTARVWDLSNGQPVHTLEGHTSSITAVAWSPDGKQLLTGSDDRTARVWDLASGQPVRTLEGHTGPVRAVAWSPDGKQLLTGSEDSTARIWIADDKPIIAELTRRVCNIFTDEDIRQTIPTWRGCAAELAAVADDLKEYDRLRPSR